MTQIEITTGTNGYPEHLHTGYVGFDTYEEAEQFAKENNGRVVELRKRDGWQLWESRGLAFGPLCVDADTYGDDYRTITDIEEWKDICRENISLLLDNKAELCDMKESIEEMVDIEEKIDMLDENEAVLLYKGKFYEIIKTRTMSYNEDVWHHIIGVEL